jgi:hypothetical protein
MICNNTPDTSWTKRATNAINDLIVKPCNDVKNQVDRQLLKALTPNQLDLVYSILAAIPVAVLFMMMPPPLGFVCGVGIYLVEMVKPNLLSERAWAILHLSSSLYLLLSVPRVMLLAYKIDSAALAVWGGLKATLGLLLTFDNMERLQTDQKRRQFRDDALTNPLNFEALYRAPGE